MDKGMDKSYLDGAGKALEKEYGQEKAASILNDAWMRYSEIVHENADEPKKMYMHTRKRIYPAIAAFDAMIKNGISCGETADFLNRFYENRAAGVGRKIRGVMKIPGIYKLVPKFFAKMTASSFGEDCGFRSNWIRADSREMRFDMLVCPYQDTCVKYGCPEVFCSEAE
ncbi:L-2-amino-thiazoline-4-carboxylic acid hydrolase [Lachnoclostridium sp. Marseille-P6806]|uniref:L-2-amino-thiazoline-4-carboxylic acid hydrolase n=1 Tax=Lachnoclostridium sp. Marseille-P6806 TaxID=2364793 RepID=UPI001030E610|nr:L-2-amino-thiazoline-4-carboxylic acid hydrolase [Lachnoclostridium sp. Marseille-P6806]